MRKILIAEDETTSRMIASKAVEQMGYCAFNSPDGRHAWETLMVNRDISLLITDVEMPILDGCDLIKRLRASNDYRHLPIIIISGVVGPKTIAGFLEQGATWFVAKPIVTEEIQEYVAKSFNQ